MAGEFERIRWLRSYLARSAKGVSRPPLRGPGDDAAAWRPPSGHEAVLSVDVQLEGTHFRREWIGWADLGHRAVAAAASDLAAMAARPGGALFSVVLPERFAEAHFRELFRGLVRAARRLGLDVLGGNLAQGALGITTTVVGHETPGRLVTRRGARRGDLIFVTGYPGRSRVGRALLESGAPVSTALERACVRAFRRPEARIEVATALRDALPIRAMVDLSDGLAPDLGHVLAESTTAGRRVGATLERSLLLPRRGLAELAARLELDPLETVLAGGEDFELLFTARARDNEPIAAVARELRLPITRIGEVTGDRGLTIDGEEGARRWSGTGFDHFDPRGR